MIKKLTLANFDDLSKRAVDIIKSGGVVVLPFDTVYGICCDPKNNAALKKIFDIKKRPYDQTIGLATDGLKTAEQIAVIDSKNRAYIRKRIPGNYTFILKAKNFNLSKYCRKNNTYGIRIPNSMLALKIASLFGGVIAQTSANISGKASCLDFLKLQIQYGDMLDNIDLIIDGGAIKSTGPSKIIDLSSGEPKEIERKLPLC